jgi:hypothetical protein
MGRKKRHHDVTGGARARDRRASILGRHCRPNGACPALISFCRSLHFSTAPLDDVNVEGKNPTSAIHYSHASVCGQRCSSASHSCVPLPTPAAVPCCAWSDDPHHQTKGRDSCSDEITLLDPARDTAISHHSYPHFDSCSAPNGSPALLLHATATVVPSAFTAHSAGVIPHSSQLLPRQGYERRGIGCSARATGTLDDQSG